MLNGWKKKEFLEVTADFADVCGRGRERVSKVQKIPDEMGGK